MKTDIANMAFFFDIDGTLAPIEIHPHQVRLSETIIDQLQALEASDAIVTLISGRTISDMCRVISPLRCRLIGVHGAEYRDQNGKYHSVDLDPSLTLLAQSLRTALNYPGIFIENKRFSLAVHYRQVPQLEDTIWQVLTQFIRMFSYLRIQEGKQVLEIQPEGFSKGKAILDRMLYPPFNGRYPIFIGDDVTDESGFMSVNQLGGLSIKVGQGITCAQYRLNSPSAVSEWLEKLLTMHTDILTTNTLFSSINFHEQR